MVEAVARGDLFQKMGISIDSRELCSDFLHVREVVNTMVDRLNSFASEATRVAREAGTEGKLGGQSSVKGVAGIWKDLGRQRHWPEPPHGAATAVSQSGFSEWPEARASARSARTS